jgi:hypothetical protein
VVPYIVVRAEPRVFRIGEDEQVKKARNRGSDRDRYCPEQRARSRQRSRCPLRPRSGFVPRYGLLVYGGEDLGEEFHA